MTTSKRAAITLAGALAALFALAALASAAPRSFYGTISQTQLTGEDFDRMGEARLGTLRFEINWSQVVGAGQSQSYDWSATDGVMGHAAEQGLRPLPYLYGTPTFVVKDLDGARCKPESCGTYAPRSKAALRAWRGFVTAAVERYGPGGEFWAANPSVPEKPVTEWQIWNEQNSPSFFRPRPDVKRYYKLLKVADRAIASADPDAEVITGGMFGTPRHGEKPAISAWDFLGHLYRIKGAQRTFDSVGIHPYAPKLSKVKAQVKLMRDEMKKAGDREVDLWITEIGWSSANGGKLNRGPKGQAMRLKQAYKLFAKKRRAWNVEGVIWYSWRDSETSVCEWCADSGLVTRDLKAKPSLKAMTKFTGGR